jgi:thiamine biosynthesis protein ThiI
MKLISLLSSGIDSPVATYLLSKKAREIILIHADIRPFTDDKEYNNFIANVKHLKKHIICDLKTYSINHGYALSEYRQNANKKYTCIFCKRMLLRYAERIVNYENADAIIMGDSLGQVASQTLQNMNVIDQAIKIPIFRPLIGFDKEEIISIAKNIGTYDLSILSSLGCIAVPQKPSTKAELKNILFEENKLNIDELVNNAVSKAKPILF